MIHLKNYKPFNLKKDFFKYYNLNESQKKLSIKSFIIINEKIFEYKGLRKYAKDNNLTTIEKNLVLKNNKIFLNHENSFFEVTLNHYKGNKVLIAKDLNDSVFQSNIMELFEEYFFKRIYNSILDKLHNRYYVFNKTDLIKELLKFKWFTKNHIRKVLPKIIQDVGIKESLCELKSGKIKKRVVPEKLMIHMSRRESIIATQKWESSFSEEFDKNDMFIQGGDSGVVLSKKGNYKTAFIEIFPKFLKNQDKTFSSFIRGEGENIKEAEKNAFNKLKKIKNCKDHKWNRNGRDNGHAFCESCGVFNSKALDPLTLCKMCNVPTTDNSINKDFYCKKHYYELDSVVLMKQKRSKRDNREFSNFKNRIYNNVSYIIKKDSFYNNKKMINKLIKTEENYAIKEVIKRNYAIDFYYAFPEISHLIIKMLLKRKKINIKEIKDNKKIKNLVFDYIHEYSILTNKKSNMKEFIKKIDLF